MRWEVALACHLVVGVGLVVEEDRAASASIMGLEPHRAIVASSPLGMGPSGAGF